MSIKRLKLEELTMNGISRVGYGLCWTLGIFSATVCLASCGQSAEADFSVPDGDGLEVDGPGAVDGEYDEAFSIVGSPLSSDDPACWTESAAKTFASKLPGATELAWVGPSDTYPTTECDAAFLVDVTKAAKLPTNPAEAAYVFAANAPISEAECARWRIGAETWNKYEDGSYNFVGGRFRWARWEPWPADPTKSYCNTSTQITWPDGWPLRVAVTVRRHQTAGDIGSTYVTKKVGLKNLFK